MKLSTVEKIKLGNAMHRIYSQIAPDIGAETLTNKGAIEICIDADRFNIMGEEEGAEILNRLSKSSASYAVLLNYLDTWIDLL